MMRRDTLHSYRNTVERERQLIDSHLEALDEIDRLKRELAEAEASPMHPLDYEGEDFV